MSLRHVHLITVLNISTKEKVKELILSMRDSIAKGLVKIAHLHRIRGYPVLFVHAGYREEYLKLLSSKNGIDSVDKIVEYSNNILIESLSKCDLNKPFNCYEDELFQAGRDRGGTSMYSLPYCSVYIIDLDFTITCFRYWWSIVDRLWCLGKVRAIKSRTRFYTR
jgi:hypothetical protein